jgi:hypothetical protein
VRSNYHVRRRLKQRLGDVKLETIVKLVKATHGYPAGFQGHTKKHFISYNNQKLIAIYDWRKHRLVTVLPLGKGDDDASV